MLGLYDLPMVGRYVVSGETPEEFLWDLFDQQVLGGNVEVPFAGARVMVVNQNEYSGDAAERAAKRGSEEWKLAHSEYFIELITEGSGLSGVLLPPELYYPLHAARTVAKALNETKSLIDTNIYIRIALYRHGAGTPEYLKALDEIPHEEYPYPNLEPIHVLNFLLLKQVLTLQETGGYPVLTPGEVAAEIARQEAVMADLRAEERRLIQEGNQQHRRKAPPRRKA